MLSIQQGITVAGGSGQPVPTSGSYAVDTFLFGVNVSGSTVTNGSTLAGSSFETISGTTAGLATFGTAQTGTWTNRSGHTVSATNGVGYFVRTA